MSTTDANCLERHEDGSAPPEDEDSPKLLGLAPNIFGTWQLPHIAALTEYWIHHRLWELPPSAYKYFYEQHGAKAHAAVRCVECEHPSAFSQADVARALHMLCCSYQKARQGPHGLESKRADRGWGCFKNHKAWESNPLKAGEVFPAAT